MEVMNKIADVMMAEATATLIEGRVKRALYLLAILDFESFCSIIPPELWQ
ncbi:MAG: hypothetical protein ACUVWK_04715 [Nitrososphaerales archaeon]